MLTCNGSHAIRVPQTGYKEMQTKVIGLQGDSGMAGVAHRFQMSDQASYFRETWKRSHPQQTKLQDLGEFKPYIRSNVAFIPNLLWLPQRAF
jgi:hypothetical protein